LPLYRNLRAMVRTSSGIPATIPAGAIVMFDAAVPSGWTRYSVQDGYFVRGGLGGELGDTGGSNTDSHTFNPDDLVKNTFFQGVTTTTPTTAVAKKDHTHTSANNVSTGLGDNRPPFITVILGKANAVTAVPSGMVGMFDANPGGNWKVMSNVGGDFYQRYIVAGASYGATGGSSVHSYDDATYTTGAVAGGTTNATTGSQAQVGSGTHTHNVTFSFSSATYLPKYNDVIIAKYLNGNSGGGSVASEVLNTGRDGARWDALAWDKTTPAGTSITFEVRARDASFLKTDTSPSWTAVGGTSPVTTGLPAGRYKQWRATLSTTDVSQTPILSEVRLYYA